MGGFEWCPPAVLKRLLRECNSRYFTIKILAARCATLCFTRRQHLTVAPDDHPPAKCDAAISDARTDHRFVKVIRRSEAMRTTICTRKRAFATTSPFDGTPRVPARFIEDTF